MSTGPCRAAGRPVGRGFGEQGEFWETRSRGTPCWSTTVSGVEGVAHLPPPPLRPCAGQGGPGGLGQPRLDSRLLRPPRPGRPAPSSVVGLRVGHGLGRSLGRPHCSPLSPDLHARQTRGLRPVVSRLPSICRRGPPSLLLRRPRRARALRLGLLCQGGFWAPSQGTVPPSCLSFEVLHDLWPLIRHS